MSTIGLEQSDLEVIVGTYEDYVVGYQAETIAEKTKTSSSEPRKKLKVSNGNSVGKTSNGLDSERLSLEQSFAVRGHSGSVRCLTGSSDGAFVFSAGYDEMMNLFSLKRRKLLQTSEGAINCATFVENSHLICGSEDGNVYIYECKGSSMKLAKTLRGHKAGVTSIDAHSSGKILLSISKDQTMRTWNLIKGRCAYVTHIKTEAHLVKWSRTGDEFVIAANNEIYLYNNLGNLKHCMKLEKRVNSIEFLTDSIFAVAIDSGKLELFDMKQQDCNSVLKFDAHESRIKSINRLGGLQGQASKSDGDDDEPGETDEASSGAAAATNPKIRFATASSDGSVKIWSVSRRRSSVMKPHELAEVAVGARITSMIVSVRKSSR